MTERRTAAKLIRFRPAELAPIAGRVLELLPIDLGGRRVSR